MSSIISAEHVLMFCRETLYTGRDGREWGHHIRSCPQPDPKLLQKIDQFVPPWEVFSDNKRTIFEPVEFHGIIQSLMVSFRALETNSHHSAGIPQYS
jgi:hypothetical protein